jgi:hypothetical protein
MLIYSLSSIPEGEQQPLLSDYHSINPADGPSLVRVPKKVATVINVEVRQPY